MISIYKVLGIALVAGGLLLWVATVLPPLPRFGLSDDIAQTQVASPLPSVDDGNVTLSGIVLYDDDRDAPVPYIAYLLPGGGTRTKQLIFRDGNGCAPEAGDLPCAPGQHASFPAYPAGAAITVSGTILGDQILVDRVN